MSRRDQGFTLVEVVMSIVLGSIIAGVTVAVMITSVNVADSTRDMSRDSTDAGLIAAFLYRDAQAAGGTDPVTLASDPTLGVSTDDWGGCEQPGGSMVARFAWIDRDDAGADHPMTVTWATFDDGRVVRRACQDGTEVDVPLGEHVATTSFRCRPGPACDSTTTEVELAVTGSAARSAETVTLTATLRPDLASSPGVPAPAGGPASPLVLVAGASECPELTLGGVRTVVLGSVLLDGACGAKAIDGDLTTLRASGEPSTVTGLRDPYAAIIPEPVGCAGLPPAPTGTIVHTRAVSFAGTTSLAAGRHVFCNGITIADGARVSGTGIFLQVVSGDVVVSAGADIDLTAATSGPYENLLLSTPGGVVRFAGGPGHDAVRGVVHAPRSLVEVQTDVSAAFGAIVADRLSVTGAGVVRIGMPIGTLDVQPSTLPAGQVGLPYTATGLVATGGTAPYTWRATGLPTGLALTPGGLLDGSPTAAGTTTATITVVDDTGLATSVQRTVTVRAQLTITSPASLPTGQTGTAYAATTITASGGATPYAFSATGLPAGLTISAAGVVSGTPTATGDFGVTVTATDAAGATATRSFTVSVRAALSIASPASLSNGTVGVAWTATTVGAAGGTGPYAFSATGLPPGLTISGAGVVSGTPTTAGTFTPVVSVTDGAGSTATRTYSIAVTATTSPSAKPFAALRGFQIFVEGATTLATWEIEGAVAAGGNLTFRNYQRIAHSETSSVTVHSGGEPLGLLVGGRVDLTASGSGSELTLDNGWFVVGSASGQSFLKFSGELHLVPAGVKDDSSTPRLLSKDKQSDLATSQAVKPNIFDFAGAFAALRKTSTALGGLTPATCPSINAPTLAEAYGNHTITLRSGMVNVWNVKLAELERINNLDTNVVPGGSTELIINVLDSGSVALPVRYWSALKDPTSSDSVIWNFPNATSVAITQSFTGSLLAPNAAVRMYDVNVAGDVVAKSLDYLPWSTELAHFNASIPCIG